jgi:signal transduction histidine kinase
MTPALILQLIHSPISMSGLAFSDGFAICGGLIQAFVAVVFVRGRAERPGWGLGWLAWSYALAALINVCSPWWATTSWGGAQAGPLGMVMALVGLCTMGALVAGIWRYLGFSKRSGWSIFGLVWLAYVVVILVGRAPALIPHAALIGNAFTAVIFAHFVYLFMRAHEREPDAGHGVAALMTAFYPPMVVGAALMGLDAVDMRHWMAVPFTLAGLGVVSGTLGRMQSELREWSRTLEQRVQVRTKELQEIVSGLESFNGMVSHDLRGPLGGINGLSALAIEALEKGDTDRALRLFGAIHQESGLLSRLVGDLLTLAKVSHADINPHKLALDALLAEALRMLDVSHGDGHADVVEHGPLPEVVADPVLLRQVLVNLVGNALKFSHQVPQPRVVVSARPVDQGVEVSVQDNGVGFEASRAAELFSPFKRLHANQAFEGHGVGLTIVRRIVERHGGRVWAESTPGQGARFSFWLPVTPGPAVVA